MLTIPTLPESEPTHDGELLAPFLAEGQHALAEGWFRWLAEQVDLLQLAADTVSTYRRGLKAWLVFLDTIAQTDRPTAGTVSSYLVALIPGRCPATVNLHLAALRALYRWTESHDIYPNIARSARAVRVYRDGPLPCLAHAQVAGLVSGIVGNDLGALRDRALIKTLYGSACRAVSMARATVGDLDLASGVLRHRPKGHRATDAIAYLPVGATTALTSYLAAREHVLHFTACDPLFIALDHCSLGSPLTTCSMRAVVRKAMERMGHVRRGPDGRLVQAGVWSAHSLRRSALTTAVDAHGFEAARIVAGHANVETTRRAYVRAKADEQMRQVRSSLDLIDT